jgi:[ribosomal protein S5]-alanine N-acetyltransferase
MSREGRMREHLWERGAWRDSFLYAVLEHEWRGASSPRGYSVSSR